MDIADAVQALLDGELAYLAAHQFGNYAVQTALRHCQQAQREAMLSALLPHLLPLSSCKHGSNVAEMVLLRASPAQLEHVRVQIFEPPNCALHQLRELMANPSDSR